MFKFFFKGKLFNVKMSNYFIPNGYKTSND